MPKSPHKIAQPDRTETGICTQPGYRRASGKAKEIDWLRKKIAEQGKESLRESLSILTKENTTLDPHNRTLANVCHLDRTCMIEKMIEDGFVKPYNRYFSEY